MANLSALVLDDRLGGATLCKRAKEFTVTSDAGALHAPDDIGLVVSEVIHAP